MDLERSQSRWAFSIGHSEKDPGAPTPGPDEYERCKQIVQFSEAMWPQMTPAELGPLYVPYASDRFAYPKYLIQAIDDINKAGVSAALELHMNNVSDRKRKGGEIFYCSEKGKELALVFREEILRWHPGVPCTIKHDKLSFVGYLGFLHKTAMPAILIEPVFFSNPDDLEFINIYWRELGEALVRGAVAYAKLKKWCG